MPNQNGEFTAADLDLSGIPGIEGLSIPGVNAPAPVGDETGSAEPAAPANPAEPVDYSQFTQPTEPADPAAQTSQGSEPAAGTAEAPAEPGLWDSLFRTVPEPLHEELRGVTAEYDRQLARREEAMAPFAEFIERGLRPDDIMLALQTHQTVIQNPRAFWEAMGSQYGWNQQPVVPAPVQGQPAAPAAPSSYDDIFGDLPADQQAQIAALPPQVQQELATLRQQNQQLAQQFQGFTQQQQQAAQAQQGRQMIDAELAQLEGKYGAFDRDEVVRLAVVNGQTGRNPSLTAAFHEMKDRENAIIQRYARTRPAAPAVVGSGSGMAPAQQVDMSKLTDDQKAQAAFALALQMGAADPNGGYQR